MERTHDLNRLSEALKRVRSPLATAADPLCKAFAGAYFTDRYPGFDLDDPDWPTLRAQVEQIAALLAAVRAHLPTN